THSPAPSTSIFSSFSISSLVLFMPVRPVSLTFLPLHSRSSPFSRLGLSPSFRGAFSNFPLSSGVSNRATLLRCSPGFLPSRLKRCFHLHDGRHPRRIALQAVPPRPHGRRRPPPRSRPLRQVSALRLPPQPERNLLGPPRRLPRRSRRRSPRPH